MNQYCKLLSLTLLTVAFAGTTTVADAQEEPKTQPPLKPETINKPPELRTSPGAEAKEVVKTQPQLKIDPKANLKIPRNPLQPATLQQSVATYQGIRSGGVATSVPLTGAAALSSFYLSVGNSGRTINTIAMAKRPDGRADMYLTGTDANDRFDAYGSWHIIPGGVGGEVSTTIRSGETFQLRVPFAPGDGYMLALGGFRISHGAGSAGASSDDPRIKQLSIKAPDHLAQAFSISGYSNSYIEGSVRTDNATRPISVMVQYVWVPRFSSFASAFNDSPPDRPDGGVRVRSQAFGSLPRSNKHVISAFEFEYLDGPQNLLSLGIHLDDAPLPNRTAGDAVTFQDNDRGDRIRWRVDTIDLE